MNQKLQQLMDLIQQSAQISDDERNALLKKIKEVDKEIEITAFKLDRTEKVKRTTAILLEESIEELEQKRKAAEAQNRELEIEASLERVRAIAMGMNKADDMLEVCKAISQQLQLLNVKEIRNVQTAIFYKEKGSYMNYEYYIKHDGKIITETSYTNHAIHSEFATKMMKGKDEFFYSQIKGEQALKDWIAYQKTTNVFIDQFIESAHSLNYYWYSLGDVALGISTYYPLADDEIVLFKRFLKVFELSYRRYLDIEKAVAQTKEAQIEAALERVRSRTLAMQKSDELAETAVVLFKQLIGLGIEPNRLYIGIVKEETGDMEMWATDEDGTEVSTKFMFNKKENDSVKKLYDGWFEKKKSVVVDMQGKELEDYLQYLNNVLRLPFKGGLSQKRRVQHVAYFSMGFIGMASPDEQPAETLLLLERFAAVFNLTFTRFNDLKVAEAHALQAELDLIEIKAARSKAEDALTELQSTQKQLIQAEKMASLGELTAGIAHEIQNPLNFVNNFSEVSKELIDELQEERLKTEGERDKDLENDILNDIIQNLEKINHHGKRADAIVKGMLQHSRASSGQKEAIDINALVDEYLRLSYHGLRAKDKSFNATLKTDFDNSIGTINIIPQDIGRVVMNIVSNAFYATNERRKTESAGYEPIVSIATQNLNNEVKIIVSDNGGGIPKNIIDKIFQPFFTTKPTGSGTGLGLSLAYDIVKTHRGELKVESKENEGADFIIMLPV